MTPPFTHAAYRDLLRAGRDAGYRFAGFGEVPALRADAGRACLLRHDCDNDLVAAARMAAIEAEEGVRSTYFLMLRSAIYNLLAPTNAALAREIVAAGHWIGLHFDEWVVREAPAEELPRLVSAERDLLAREIGAPVEAVSFHQPGARILEAPLRLDVVHSYDREALAGFHYTADSNLAFRSGHPADLFAAGDHRRLHVLVHPEWWTPEPLALDAKWDLMLANNLSLMQGSLLAREATFLRPRRLVIDP